MTEAQHIQALRDSFDLVDVPMAIFRECGPHGFQIAYVNASYERNVGFAMADIAGRDLTDIFPARLAATATEQLLRCLKTGQSVTYDEVITQDGREFWWQTTMTPSQSPDGPLITAVLIDTSRHYQRDLSNAHQIARLNALYKDIRDFAGLTAHDMRAPLANVVSLTQLILHDFKDMGDNKREMIEMCSRVAVKSIAGIDQIMDRVERLDSGPLTLQETDLSEICRDLASMVDPHGKLTISYPQARMRTDTVILRLALRNLLDNAARFCDSRIEITCERGGTDAHQLSQGHILLSVRDDGPGFEVGATLAAAKPDQDASSSHTRGFGLRTVANLLSSRGGFLRIDPPQDGKGARLSLGLPGEWLDDEETA